MKKKGLLSKLMAGVLAFGLCLSVGGSMPDVRAAEPEGSGPVLEGTETSYPSFSVTKTVEMPVGSVSRFTGKFVFDFVPVDGAPALSSITIKNAMDAKAVKEITNGTLRYTRQSDAFTLYGFLFKNAGFYTYQITEEPDTVTGLAEGQSITYSGKSYTMKVWVDEKADQSGFYVKNVTFENEAGEKIDPAKGELVFNSVYDDGIETPATAKFTVDNTIVGTYADKSRTFEYELTIADTKVTYTAPITVKINGVEQSLAFGEKYAFTLKGAETLEVEAPFGTTFDVTAAAAENYTHTYELYWEDGTKKSTQTGGKGKALSGRVLSGQIDNASSAVIVLEQLKWIHTYDDSVVPTPMGAIINNLPFIILIVVAAAGIAVCVMMKKKRRG